MTIKQRVAKLEAKGEGHFDLVKALEGGRKKHRALRERLDAMSEAELIELAFDDQGGFREREAALKRLIANAVEVQRAKDTLDELVRAKSARLREQAENAWGRERETLLWMADAALRVHFMQEDRFNVNSVNL